MIERSDFEEFVGEHLDVVYGFTAARIGRAAADDVVAGVFRSARRTFDSGEGEVLSRSWLLTCTRSRILAHWRHAVESDEPVDGAPVADTPRAAIEWTAERALDALDCLPDAQRAVLALRYLEGRPLAEVAHMIDRPHTTTRLLLEKAWRAFHTLTLPQATPTAVAV